MPSNTGAAAVEAFEAELLRRDPDGAQLAAVNDVPALARAAVDLLLDSAATWQAHLGAFYDTDGIRALLGKPGQPVSKQAVSKRRDLLALTTGSGRKVFPQLQFQGRAPVAGLGDVLAVLPEPLISRWTIASWLISPAADLDDQRPIDALADGNRAAVIAAARSWAAALAA